MGIDIYIYIYMIWYIVVNAGLPLDKSYVVSRP